MNANINASGEAVIPGITSDVALVAWYGDEEDNTKGPITAMTYLHNATKSWTNVKPMNSTYEDREYLGSSYGYQSFISTNGIAVITASDGGIVKIGSETEPLRIRMPIITEIENAVNSDSFLNSNLDLEFKIQPMGYWTMSSSVWSNSNADAVSTPVSIGGFITNKSYNGVRPVITVKLN